MHNRSILPGVPVIESPFFDEIVASGYFTDAETPIAAKLNRDGFVVLPGFITDIAEKTAQIKATLQPLFEDCKQNGDKDREGILASRIQDAFRFSETVREIACDPRILSLLTKLYGRQAFAFQTLNFEYGSQQPTHSDAVHFHSAPERFMCGVWVALEDITLENGPLHYFAGSHKLPLYDCRQVGYSPSGTTTQTVYETLWGKLITLNDLQKDVFLARAGDMLIWSTNLLHGGEPILQPQSTRWSQVTHYFFEDCGYFTPMHSDLFAGQVAQRMPTDIATGAVVNGIAKQLTNTHTLNKKNATNRSSSWRKRVIGWLER